MSDTVIGVGSIVKSCQRCGQQFKTTPARHAQGKGIFCSRACYVRNPAAAENLTTVSFGRLPSSQGTERTCDACSAAFRVSPIKVRQGQDAYCSQPCYSAAQKRAKNANLSKPAHVPKAMYENDIGRSGLTSCARCARIRELGVRCICEWEMVK